MLLWYYNNISNIIREVKQMCNHHEYKYTDDVKGCAEKHIKTRELLAESTYKAADIMLKCAEEHLKELWRCRRVL
jgi:hypothetical protein